MVRNVIRAGTSVQFASTAASRGQVGSGMQINSAEIREAVRTLKTRNARPVVENKYVGIIHPNAMADLLNDTDAKLTFQHAAGGPAQGDSPMYTGVVGDYLGVRFVESSRASVRTSLGLSGADVYETIFVGAQSYAVTELSPQQLRIYFKPRGSAGSDDALDQRASLGYKTAFTSVILNENFLLRLEHNTSASTAA